MKHPIASKDLSCYLPTTPKVTNLTTKLNNGYLMRGEPHGTKHNENPLPTRSPSGTLREVTNSPSERVTTPFLESSLRRRAHRSIRLMVAQPEGP
ncbi:hypothetical protein AVEN_84934-1 [Araneus ventricosus]|uniref:Uncharacterized protein n=1 Tax=Araneus ventricosus TaxID=182803 RepID=A0A4Y2BYT1_ARAVE|nr:hypothetical protein AVEN_84934-1 [Araneus ventricosus]